MAEWNYLNDLRNADARTLPSGTLVEVLGRYDDVYGPVPVELIKPEAWNGEMPCAAHDLKAWRLVDPAA